MNKFQIALIEYLKEYTEIFIESILAEQSAESFYIQDVYPLVINFLQSTLKRDLTLYEAHSTGYHKIQDMLIETYTTKRDSELSVALINAIKAIYRN